MIPVVREVVQDLVAREFVRIAERDVLKLINSEEIRREIDDYPGILTMPPDDAFDTMEVYGKTDEWGRVDIDLWYDNARSDLTLSCKIIRRGHSLDFGIESIHVL